jgi:hypothetical protein
VQFNGRPLPVDLGAFSLWGQPGVDTTPLLICRRLLTEGELRFDTTARFALELRDRSRCTDQDLARRRLSGVYASVGDEWMLVIPNAPAPYNQITAVRRGDELDVRFVDDHYRFRRGDASPRVP